MSWDFCTEPEFQQKLDWADRFVTDEVEPLDLAFPDEHFDIPTAALRSVIDPLKQRVKAEALWAAHLEPDLGGQGYGQVRLALLNEILGRSSWAPLIFGTQAPDTGNAEILAKYGTDEQKAEYLAPLLEGEIFSCFSMTEPHAGSDPKLFTTRAVRDGDHWVINGEKFFSSNAHVAAFFIVMAVTDPDVSPYEGMSMILVPAGTPGITMRRNVATMYDRPGEGHHGWLRYDNVRVSEANVLGGEGKAFVVAQTRLGGGRIHHAMRTVAVCKQAFDMMCQRAATRHTQGSLLGEKQLVQAAIADSWMQINQLRLLVLHTAWLIDKCTAEGDLSGRRVRKEIAACKVQASRVMHDVVYRALHTHGALGVSQDTRLARMWQRAPSMGIVDGPTEVHQVTIARQLLRQYAPYEGVWPPYWLPPRIEEARARYADVLAAHEAEKAETAASR
ncbi:MAG TPA: acyl-CoA dehydrogenase family protein [Amycolatopsis sp.]|nr:acyl-CoA dehydrogenase family protein [Amycolatopsis sp.]